MSIPLEQFVQHLEDSGILASETIKDFVPPKASPKDAEELARELVRKKKLTKFQAEEVFRGKGELSCPGQLCPDGKNRGGGHGRSL